MTSWQQEDQEAEPSTGGQVCQGSVPIGTLLDACIVLAEIEGMGKLCRTSPAAAVHVRKARRQRGIFLLGEEPR